MIKYIKGDIFQSSMQTLVCPVNTVGVMGKGLAKEFAQRCPEMESRYQHSCKTGNLRIGHPWLYTGVRKWILCFPTKAHWRNLSKLEYIGIGLENFALTYEIQGITSIAFPKLGCGLGGLDWSDVKLLFDLYLDLMDIPVELYI